MKKSFSEYYDPTNEEISDLWKNSLFVLDANVILSLYRYSTETTSELIKIFEKVSDRIWIPHQAAEEYHRNRLTVIFDQAENYKRKEQAIDKVEKEIIKILDEILQSKAHPFIKGLEKNIEHIKDIFKKIKEDLTTNKNAYSNLIRKDYIRERITKLFDGKVGTPYSEEKLEEIYKQGMKRYKQEIPPGYKDSENKEGNKKYGDLVLWFQIIDEANENKKSIIFVTDDKKDDWWLKYDRDLLGPRPELLKEIRLKAGVRFHMYLIDRFMENTQKYIESKVKKESINEVRELRKEDVRAVTLDDYVKNRLIDLETKLAVHKILSGSDILQVLEEHTKLQKALIEQQYTLYEALGRDRSQVLEALADSSVNRLIEQQYTLYEALGRDRSQVLEALADSSVNRLIEQLRTLDKALGRDISQVLEESETNDKSKISKKNFKNDKQENLKSKISKEPESTNKDEDD